MNAENVLTVSTLFQSYLDIYRTQYGMQSSDVQAFYDPAMWSFLTKDQTIAYNIVITPHINCLPVPRAEILQNKILVLVVYFDDVKYYKSIDKEKKYFSMHVNPFLDYFHCEIKKCVVNSSQKANLNMLRYNHHTKPELVEAFQKAYNILKRPL